MIVSKLERWKMAIVLVLSLLLAGLAYVGATRAQIKEEDVDFEVMATITIKKGDNLWNIAKEYYGDPLKWTYIKEMNKIPHEGKIKVGTVIYIPVKDAKKIVKKVEEEIVAKKTVEQELSEKIAALQEEMKACETRNEQLTKELEDRDASVKDLEGMLDNIKAALDKMKTDTESELEAQASEMRATAERHRAELAEIGTAKDEKDRQIEDLRAELSRCRGDIGMLERLRDELQVKIGEAEAVKAKPPKPPISVQHRSTVAAIAIALVGSIIWMASD